MAGKSKVFLDSKRTDNRRTTGTVHHPQGDPHEPTHSTSHACGARPRHHDVRVGRRSREVHELPRHDRQGSCRRGAQGRRLLDLPHGARPAPRRHEDPPDGQLRSGRLRRLPHRSVQVALRRGRTSAPSVEEGRDGPGPRPVLRPRHGHARLHEGARPAARPRLHGDRPVHWKAANPTRFGTS